MSEIANGAVRSANGVAFNVPGVPVGKGRPRFARQGGFTKAYTPEKTANYEGIVRLFAMEAMAGSKPFKRPVALLLTVSVPIPQSWSKKRRDLAFRGLIGATTKPDFDNYAKLIADAMNGIVYDDDKQIVSATIVKQYGTVPHVAVRVQEYQAKEAA